jgi:hypothetical protein
VKDDIVICEALCLKCNIKGVHGTASAIYGQENYLTALLCAKAHIITEPALHTAMLVIVASGALVIIGVA